MSHALKRIHEQHKKPSLDPFNTVTSFDTGPKKIPDPVVAPDPESAEAKIKAQRDLRRRQSGGRASTVLSGSNTLG